jgi:hypothetical protein
MTHNAKKLCAIAVPLSMRNSLTEDELTSFRHLERHLNRYDRYLVMPESLQMKISGFEGLVFDNKYFGSALAHNKLLLSAHFYDSFRDYEYVLIYHSDALVFSDQLEEWCRKGYDYVAPPWIKHESAPYAGNAEYEGKVGNGGFSLRKIDSFLKVLTSNRLSIGPVAKIISAIRYGKSFRKYTSILKFFLYCHPKYNGVRIELGSYSHNEDHFWANRASHYYPGFKVAPVDVALEFAFECAPGYCYELNGRNLPFGCHAWNKYDRAFWEPFLIRT